MFPESLYFLETQHSTIIQATFPSKRFPCGTIHFYHRLQRCWKHFWKPFCESLSVFRRILNYVRSITKAPSHQCWFKSRKQVTIRLSQIRSVGDTPARSHCS